MATADGPDGRDAARSDSLEGSVRVAARARTKPRPPLLLGGAATAPRTVLTSCGCHSSAPRRAGGGATLLLIAAATGTGMGAGGPPAAGTMCLTGGAAVGAAATASGTSGDAGDGEALPVVMGGCSRPRTDAGALDGVAVALVGVATALAAAAPLRFGWDVDSAIERLAAGTRRSPVAIGAGPRAAWSGTAAVAG
jgi:hypothetical protein